MKCPQPIGGKGRRFTSELKADRGVALIQAVTDVEGLVDDAHKQTSKVQLIEFGPENCYAPANLADAVLFASYDHPDTAAVGVELDGLITQSLNLLGRELPSQLAAESRQAIRAETRR